LRAAYLNFISMQQQKQLIEYWFETNLFSAPVLVKIKMIQRDEAKAKVLFEEMFESVSCKVIAPPAAGIAILLVTEVWEL
jgi:hypothetical protein